MTGLKSYQVALEALQSRGRYRTLLPREGYDFSSNDYLGLASSDFMQNAARDALNRGVSVGAGGSRLLRGNASEHELLEQEAAHFFGSERALYFNSGFTANSALLSTLPRPDDLILYDTLIHASSHEGMQLSRAANRPFNHNDVTHAESQMKNWREEGGKGTIWLCFETVYSMDGDLAPVPELLDLAERYDALVIADEAHATGVFGVNGRGFIHEFHPHPHVISVHTCGKALGVVGALVCGAAPLIETLVNRARGFIFATAPSPLDAALVRASLQAMTDDPARCKTLQKQMAHAHQKAEDFLGLKGLQSQIIPVIIGDDKKTMALAQRMQDIGFDIRGIRPPTVPRGTSRLRLSITLNVEEEIITKAFEMLSREREAMS